MTRTRKIILISCLAVFAFVYCASRASAATNIDADVSRHWAWSDSIGWIDFYNTNTITVTSQKLTGYASSTAGDISLDCATTRSGNICAQSDYSVTNNGLGNLSGWGWNDLYGWISFDCNNNDGCGVSSYRVYIDTDTGEFNNYAWNDAIGWISFNCADLGGGYCGGISNYKVATSWQATSTNGRLDSSIFDTEATRGAQINSLVWQGSVPAGTSVRFQIASSNSPSGPWTFIGPDGSSGTYYTADPNTSMAIDRVFHNDKRYFRYRVILISNLSQTESPRVDDIIVNWSP